VLLRFCVLGLALLILALAAACGGGDEDRPLYLRGSDGAPTATSGPDTDADGVADADDACPDGAERPGGVDFEAPDGCPDSLDDLVAFAIADIGKYWRQRLQGISVGYVEPEVIPYRSTTQTACGQAPPDNAIYCGFDNSIYYDEGLLEREFDDNGDFAPIMILAHEWGHLVQAHVGFFALDLYTIDYELQADCMAGVYARNANQRKLLALGDLDEAAATLLRIGDDANEVAWYDEGAHGTAEERTYAFNQGFEQGLGICASVADEAKSR
jgi:predicted metalloprotease